MRLGAMFLMRTCTYVTAATSLVIAQAVAQNRARGGSVVRGMVTSRGSPLHGASVVRRGVTSESLTTDTTGRFIFTSIALGRHVFLVHRVGFAPSSFEVEFLADTAIEVDVPIDPLVEVLDTIRVAGRGGIYQELLESVGFEERRRQAERSAIDATFLTPEQIAARRASQFSHLLEGQRSIHVRYQQGLFAIPYGRDGQCVMSVWLDGREVRGLFASGSVTGVNFIDPTQIAAIEIYPSPSGTPPQFSNLTGNCGAIVIWTK